MTEPAADRRRPGAVAHFPAAPPSRHWPKEPIVHFPVHLRLVSKYNSEPSPFLGPSRCICDPVRSAGTPTPGLGLRVGHLRANLKRLRAAAHFPPSPPECTHASGLLLTPPRAMRCEPPLCCSRITSSSAPNRCFAQPSGLSSADLAVAYSESDSPLFARRRDPNDIYH